jgi:hypothetical protein
MLARRRTHLEKAPCGHQAAASLPAPLTMEHGPPGPVGRSWRSIQISHMEEACEEEDVEAPGGGSPARRRLSRWWPHGHQAAAPLPGPQAV